MSYGVYSTLLIIRWPGRSPLERKAIFKLSAERKAQSAKQGALWDGIGFRYVTVHSRDLLALYSPIT